MSRYQESAAALPWPTIPRSANYVGERVFTYNYDDTAIIALINNASQPQGIWNNVSGHFLAVSDTTNVRAGVGGLTLTKPGYALTTAQLKMTVSSWVTDLSNCMGMLRVYIAPGTDGQETDYDHLNYISMKIYKAADASNFHAYTLWNNTAQPATGASGWYELHFCTNWNTGTNGGTGANLSDIDTVEILMEWNNVSAATPGVGVTLDQLMFFKPKNTKPLLVFSTDATYDDLKAFTAYVRGLTFSGSNAKLRPALLVNTNVTQLDRSGHITTAQLPDVLEGNVMGVYGEDNLTDRWLASTLPMKRNMFRKMYDFCSLHDLPIPRFMAISGTKGWLPSDHALFLGRYAMTVTGHLNYANQYTTNNLFDPRYVQITYPDFLKALVSYTSVNAAASTNRLEINNPVSWTGVRPIMFISAAPNTLPASTPAVNNYTIYWYKYVDSTHGTVHLTFSDAVAGTNAIDITADETGYHHGFTTLDFASEPVPIGTLLARWIADKSLWCGFTHAAATGGESPSMTDAQVLAHAKFQAAMYASLVNGGEIEWVSFDDLFSGKNITGL